MNRRAAIALVLVSASTVLAQGRPALVVGTVIDRATGLRISGVAVSATGGANTASTDEEGFFALAVSPGRLTLGFSRAGYIAGGLDTATTPGDTLRLHFTMTAGARSAAQPLDPVAVVTQGAGLPTPFLRRMALKGGGRYFVADDIKKLNPPHVPGLLQRITGGMMVYTGGSMVLVTKRGQSGMRTRSGDDCPYDIILNDIPMPVDFDLRAIRPEDIVGIEVYNGPSSVPVELGGTKAGDPACGVVAIWTRGGR